MKIRTVTDWVLYQGYLLVMVLDDDGPPVRLYVSDEVRDAILARKHDTDLSKVSENAAKYLGRDDSNAPVDGSNPS